MHVPLVALQTYWHAFPLLFHVPLLSQTCGCNPLHRFALGVQAPAQAPLLLSQTKGQLAPEFFQAPVASQA